MMTARSRSIFAFFAILGWISLSVAALDQPESYVRRSSNNKGSNRELQTAQDFTGGAGEESCPQKLAQCTVVIGGPGVSLPYAQWGKMLATLEKSAEDSSASDALRTTTSLRHLMATIEEIDFNAVGDSLQAMASAGNEANFAALRDVATDLNAELQIPDNIPIHLFNKGIGIIETTLNKFGFIFHVDVTPILDALAVVGELSSIITILIQVLAALPGGPVAVVGVLKLNFTAIVDIVELIVGIATGNPPAGLAGLSPAASSNATISVSNATAGLVDGVDGVIYNGSDKQCAQDLVQCHFDRLVLQALPSMVAGAFLLDSMGQ